MNFKLLIFLIFYILININIVYSYIIKDIRVTNTYPKGYLYSGTECKIQYTFFCSVTQVDEQCNTLTYSIPLASGSSPVVVFYNDTSSIIMVSWDFPVGTTTVTINDVYSFNYTCLEISINDVKGFKLLGKGSFVYPEMTNKILLYGAIYEIEGLDKEILLPYDIIQSKSLGYTASVLSNHRVSIHSDDSLKSNTDFSSKILLEVSIHDEKKTFSIDPIIKESYDQVYDIKTYPSSSSNNFNITNLILQGNGEFPILSFKLNNTIYNSQYVINRNSLYASTNYFPIYGDQYSTTFLYSMSNLVATEYEIYYQSGPKYSKSNQTIYSNNPKTPLPNFDSSQYSFETYTSPNSVYDSYVQYKYIENGKYISLPVKVLTNYIELANNYYYPFGYSKVYNNRFELSYCFPSKVVSKQEYKVAFFSMASTDGPSGVAVTSLYSDSSLPKITDYEEYHLKNDLYLYRIYVDTPNNFSNIRLFNLDRFGYESIISGNLTIGVYEVIQSSIFENVFSVYDIYGGDSSLGTNVIVNLDPKVFLKPQSTTFDMFSISNVSFLYNDIDVSDHRQYNVLYFNYTDEKVPRETVFSMLSTDPSLLSPVQKYNSIQEIQFFYSTYDNDIQLFKIEFYIDANVQWGEYLFTLYATTFSLSSESLDTKLRIKKTNTDFQGPLLKEISNIFPQNNILNSTNKYGEFGYKFTIEDPINGFDYGYLTVRGVQDYSVYNFTINSKDDLKQGDIYLGEYQILFKLEYPCISIDYYIDEVLLVDRMGRKTFNSYIPPNEGTIGVASPFLNLLDQPLSRVLQVKCSGLDISDDSTPPELLSFSSSAIKIDVGKTKRQITFIFTAQDLESGLKNYQYPMVYLSTAYNKILQFNSTIVSINSTTATYECIASLPLGYAYPDQILVSVYGFINRVGLSSGYDTAELNLMSTAFIDTEFDQTINEPSITHHYRISENGGELLLFGRGFISSSTFAYITYFDGSISIIKASTVYPTVIKVQNVKATARPYQVYVKVNSLISNNLTVTPTVYDYYLNGPPLEPTLTPAPTNAPQSCPGKPECGGPSNGKCITNQGCVCYSPWVGLDCLSQIIIINPPKANETSPSTNITLPTTDNNNSTVTYKSLITLVSIREIDLVGGVVFSKSFDKWEVKQIDNTTFVYNTTLEIDKKDNKASLNIRVTLKWFVNETSIVFAYEKLLMNPSTMKYTIEIGSYPFSSELNQLQLVMSASIQSDKNENICSVREFGETTQGDNSNYLKIQVDDHSLYGRFIRRGIVDSTISTISNVLLDKDMKSITTNNQLQSFIGIEIPHFKNNIILDPDFSVLIDSNKASSKSNSICSNKSKLTGAKIAGIVIGCTAFVAVIVVAVSYHIIKKKKDAKFISNVNQKMKQMNNDKL